MTTHALSEKTIYNSENATYGWAGSAPDGSCTIRSILSDGTLFPDALEVAVKIAKKDFQFSGNLGKSTASDNFWVPSMFEMHGIDYPSHSPAWWPSSNEGTHYKAFSENQISQSSCNSFKDIDKLQNGTATRTHIVWSRYLHLGNANGACGVFGFDGCKPTNAGVSGVCGIVDCFVYSSGAQ